MLKPKLSSLLLTSFFALAACGDDGSAFYSGAQSAALGAGTNQADCATCHDVDGDKQSRAGTSLKDIAFRAAYKGGDAPALLDGVNACVTGWMGGTALTATDDRYVQLRSYLESISDPAVTAMNPLAPEVLADEAAYELAYAGGDAAAGAAKYQAACAGCHDAGKVIGSAPALAKSVIAGETVGRIAQKVRSSGPPPSGTADGADSTPGPMPFFEPADLSAQDLKDIIAHLEG
jgi:cytochrome c2